MSLDEILEVLHEQKDLVKIYWFIIKINIFIQIDLKSLNLI